MSLIQYFKETRAEMSHVTWPARKTVVIHTVIIIVVALLVGLLLTAFDYVFKTGLENILFNF